MRPSRRPAAVAAALAAGLLTAGLVLPASPATAATPAAATTPAAVAVPRADGSGGSGGSADASAANGRAEQAASRAQARAAAIRATRIQIMVEAARLAGIPYRAGGTSPNTGFDCSGFTSYVFRQVGISLPRVSRDQWASTTPIPRSQAKRGDMVFFHSGGRVYHAAIYAGGGRVWHSPRTGDVVSRVPIWSSHVFFGRVPALQP